MDRESLIKELNRAVNDDITALDSRHSALFTAALEKGFTDKFLSTQERANYSNQLNKRRELLFTTPMKDGDGKVITKPVKLFNGKSVTKPMTIKDVLEYDKDEQGNIIPNGKYRIPEGMLAPIYPDGQVGKVAPQNVGTTLGKQENLAKQFAGGQQAAKELERRSGESALTPGAYGSIAAGGIYGMAGGLASDAQAIARIRSGEDREKVFQDIYGEQTASPTEDAFGFGAQSTRFIGQTAMRGVLPAITGMVGAGMAGAAGTAAGLNPITGLAAGFGGAIAGGAAGQKFQEGIFNALAGDTGKQLTDPNTGKPMVDPATGKPVYENSFTSSGGMTSKMGEGNFVGNVVGNLLPNLVAGSYALPAILNFKKIAQVARLGMAARSGEPAAIAALGKMGISKEAAEAAIAMQAAKPINTGIAAKVTSALSTSRPVTAGKTAVQWLGEASGITKTLSPIQQQMKNAAIAIKAHPELNHFLNELGESAAETGTEVQQAYQNHQQIKEYNIQARAKGLEEQAEPSLIEDLINVLGGVSFEGQHRLGTMGFRAGAALVNKPLSAMGFDLDPRTRAISESIRSKVSDKTIDAVTGRTKVDAKHQIIGIGNGEFAVYNPETKEVRLTNAAGIDPRAFGLRTGETAPTGQASRMAGAIDTLLPAGKFGKIREFKPAGDNKEIVLGGTHDGMVIRRQVGADNKIDVRVVSVDQLHPDNQKIGMEFLDKAGMKPSSEKEYVEEHPYTDIHEEGNLQREMSGKDYKSFKEAFPAVVALDQNLSVHGRVIRMVGKTHAVVQIPSIGNGTDIVVVPIVNLMTKGDSIRQREAIDDNETNLVESKSEIPQDPKNHNPASSETDRISSSSLDGGRNPIMLTPEQATTAASSRTEIASSVDALKASGMAEGVLNNKRGNLVKTAKGKLKNSIAKDSDAYAPGSYIEHKDASGNIVGGIVIRNTPHGPLVRPLDNGLPYVAQHTTITSGESVRPKTESTAPTAETAGEDELISDPITTTTGTTATTATATSATTSDVVKPEDVKFIEVTIPQNAADPYGDSDIMRFDVITGEMYMPDAAGNYHLTSQPSSLVVAMQTNGDVIERIDVASSPKALINTPFRFGFGWRYNVKTGKMRLMTPSKTTDNWEDADAADYRTLDASGKSIRVGEAKSTTSKRLKTSRKEAEYDGSPVSTIKNEVPTTSTPTDEGAAQTRVGRIATLGTFEVKEVEGKAIAVINTALQGKTITELIAQKPRTKSELIDALTDFLIGTPYKGGVMSAEDARKGATALANLYDRMIYAQANRLLQMAQDRLAGFNSTRVASPSDGVGEIRKQNKEDNEYRVHREGDLPLIDNTVGWLDDAVKSLTGDVLTWSQLNSKSDDASKKLAVQAVEIARRKLMSDYYDTSVPAIGKFEGIEEIDSVATGVYAAVENEDGQVAGRMLIGFARRDFSTAVHEIAHALFEAMPEDMKVDTLKHLGHTPREKDINHDSIIAYEAHEKFATAFETTLLNAEHPTEGIKLSSRRGVPSAKLDGVFTDLAPFMRDVYGVVYGETGPTSKSLTWQMQYKGMEDYIYLWDNMPLIVNIDGVGVRCKIPLVPRSEGTFKKGPGIQKKGSTFEFEVEIVHFGNPDVGKIITITNADIAAIGGLTNGFNTRMASTLAYWLGNRRSQEGTKRKYTGITDYAETSPARISGTKARGRGINVTPSGNIEGTATGTTAVEGTPTPEPGSESPITPDSRVSTAPKVVLPAPQMADKGTFVSLVVGDIKSMPGTGKLNPDQLKVAMEALYDANRQNSSIARDKWEDYEFYTQRTQSGAKHIGIKNKTTGMKYLVNMVTGDVRQQSEGSSSWEPVSPDKAFARLGASAMPYTTLQAGIDAMWQVANAPEDLKPKVKGFLHYIAELHGQAKSVDGVTVDWLPMPRTDAMPKNVAELETVTESETIVDGNKIAFETINTGRNDVKAIDYDGHKIVIVRINGVKVPFYVSSGKAGKVKVQPGRWYPIFGIGSDGWINKGTTDEIVSHYGSPTLKAVAEHLDITLGDLRGINLPDFKEISDDSPLFTSINDGMISSTHSDSGEKPYSDAINDFVNRVETSKSAIKVEAEKIKATRKKNPSPLQKIDSTDAAILNAVGMKDLTQADLDAIGRELLPEQYALVNNPDTPPSQKEALLRLGYAKKIAGIITASSTDKEVAQGDQKNSNARQARLQVTSFVDEVIIRSRKQVAIAEEVDRNGQLKVFSNYELLTEPTDANPVVNIREKSSGDIYNVNVKTGVTTITLPDGSVNTQKGLGFLESPDGFKFSAPNANGTETEYVGTVVANMNIEVREKQIAKKQGIPLDKMPQVYPGMLHVARILIAGSTNGKPVAPSVPSNVLWKIHNTKAFNESISVPLYQLRQADRNIAVGKPVETINVPSVNDATVKSIMAQEHDNHSMKLIDNSEIMRVKSKDEPTSAQELRASIIDQKVKEIMNSRSEILSKLREEIKKTGGGTVADSAEPFVYRIIEPSEYIDEETGQFAVKYEMDGNDYVLNDADERVPVLDKDGEPVKDTRLIEKYVMSYSKQPSPTADKSFTDMSSLDVYHEDGTRITDANPFQRMERAVKSGKRYVFYDAILPSKNGNGSSKEAQDKALDFIIQSYKTLAARMLQKYTPIVQWEGNDIAGAQVWARSVPELVIKTPKMNGVSVANVLIGAAKTAYNIDAVGATNRWQSTKITQYEAPITTPVSDTELRDAVTTSNQHYYSVHRLNGKYTYKITATNISTKNIGVFTSDKTYGTEALAKKAAQEEYKLLRGQAYDIWHQIGAEKIANDVIKLAELSRKDFSEATSENEKKEIFNARVIMRQYDWYRGVSKKIMQRYGAAGLSMADLVGGTSPQTPVDSNWTNAVQALQMMNRTATYERIVREYSDDKYYFKVPFNTERSVQVFAIWRAIQAKAVYWRGANVDGTNPSPEKKARQRNARKKDYAQYIDSKGVNETEIRSESDEVLRDFLGDDIVSKLETKIPDSLKRKMLEDVVVSLVQSTIWTKNKGGQDPLASFTGWAQKTDDWLPTDFTKVVSSSGDTTETKFTNQTKKMDFTILPRNVFSGSKFGANTDNVLQGMFNTWLDITEEGQAPKARNFSLNLVGLSSGATIDVWAARYVRRMYHEWHQTTPDFNGLSDADKTFFARVPPAAEQGVEGGYLGKSHYSVKYGVDGVAEIVPAKYQRPNPAEPTTGGEFGTGQAVMGMATNYINAATGDALKMLPSDLQAIVWFAEKQLWMNNGWTNASGAGGSFEYQFAQDILRYGELDRFNVMMSGNGVAHLSPEQKERLMQIMRQTLWTGGPTAESSPVAHLSALVSNSSGDQLDVEGQTQVDINLVAKRGSTPLKPYDPENDIQAVVLNMTPEGIKDILNGRTALTLPSNILYEHAGRRMSLAYRDGKVLRIVGTAVFDSGQSVGNGAYQYMQVASNELTDSRPVILNVAADIKDLPENIDTNQLIHIKPNMWVKSMKTYVNSATENGIYPARTDGGKHRRIREHVAYNINILKNAAADMLRITGSNDAVISRVVGEIDGSDNIDYNPESNVRIGHELYFKPALADERIDEVIKKAYNTRFSEMIRRMENFFRERNSHVQFVVQQDPRNQHSKASLVNGNVGILAIWSPETEMRYLDYGAGIPDNMLTAEQKQNNAKLADYMSGDADRIRKYEEEWNKLFTEFWANESKGFNGPTIPIFQNFANHYDVNAIHKEALNNETETTTGIDDKSIAWGLGIREKLEHSVQQLGIVIGDGRVVLEANTRVEGFNEVFARDVEKKLQSSAPIRVALYQTKRTSSQQEFHVHAASYAGTRMPGLSGIYDYAVDALIRDNQEDYEKAMGRLSDRTGQELERVFGGLDGVEVQSDRSTGILSGQIEPSIDATVKIDVDKYSVDYVLARAAHLGLMFRQQNVYVTQDAGKYEIAGEENNGYTVEYRATFKLSEPISFSMMKDMQKSLNLGGVNLSQDGKTLSTFTVSTDRETHEQTREQWHEGVSQIAGFLQSTGVSATFKEDTCRLWNTGSEGDGAYGKFTSYGEILDNLRRNNPSSLVPFVNTTKFNRNVEEVKADVEFALSMLRGRDIKLPDQISFKRTPLSVESQMSMADNYDRLPYNAVVPGPYYDPMVVKAYRSLVKELSKQWKWLNVKIDFMPRNVLPNGDIEFIDSYNASTSALIEDIRNNNHLYIYPTTPDTFGGNNMDFTGHPLLEVSPYKTTTGEPLVWNDVLRGVHDALAHSIYGASFGANGEEIAFATHALLTEDPMAIWALNNETRAQNSWVNFNSNLRNLDGSMKSVLPNASERPFAAQKAALMPIQTLYTGIELIDDRIDKLRNDMEKNHNGYNGSIPLENIVDSPMTDGFKVKGVALFQTRQPLKNSIINKDLYVAGDVNILSSDGVSIDPDLLKETVSEMKSIKDGYVLLARLGRAYLGHIQRGDIVNPQPEFGNKGYEKIVLDNTKKITAEMKLHFSTTNVNEDERINTVLKKVNTYQVEAAVHNAWSRIADDYLASNQLEVVNNFTRKKGLSSGNLQVNKVTGETVNHHGQVSKQPGLKKEFERDSSGRILMYHATLHGKSIGNKGDLLAGDDLSWMSGSETPGLGGSSDRISLTYNRLYAIDVLKMLTNYMSIVRSTNPQKVLNSALTERVDAALIDNEPGAINDRIRYKFTRLALAMSDPVSFNRYSEDTPDESQVILTYEEAYKTLMDLYKDSGSVSQFNLNLSELKYKAKSGKSIPYILNAVDANKAHQNMGTKRITTPEMAVEYHQYIKSLSETLGIPYTLILEEGLNGMLSLKDNADDIKPVIYQYAIDPNMLAEHVPSEEELRTYTTGIMEHTGKIFDADGDEIESVSDGFMPNRPAFAWSLPRKGAVPIPPATPPAAPPPTTFERFLNVADTVNDFCRISIGGDASPILIQNFLLANPIEDPKLFFQQFLIMTKAARPNLSLSWKGRTIIQGKNYGRQADVDLGNELRANLWYESAGKHGLTLSAIGKDEALKEMQKTNPSATLMDLNELGYIQDVSISNEILRHMPGQGQSERFFSMSKDYVKMNKYAQAVQHLVDIGYIPGTEGFESSARDIAAIINVAAGDMKFTSNKDKDDSFGRIAKVLFFAPRWASSRFALDPLGSAILRATPWGRDVLRVNRLGNLEDRDPYAKAMHLRMMAKTYGMWAAFALLYGILSENDAVSTSIGKGGMSLQIGDYKFKPPGGIDKTIAMVSNAWSMFEVKDNLTREEKIAKVGDSIKTMMLGQAAPGVSAVYETIVGRNLFGEPSREVYTPLQSHWDKVTRPLLAKSGVDVPLPKISNLMADKFIYLWAQDMMESYEAMANRDEPFAEMQSAIIGGASFIGGRAKYSPKELKWTYDAGKNRLAPGIENTFIGAEKFGSGDMQWDKLTR
jgi:hypothetical protein